MDKAFHFQRRRTAQAFWIVGIAISLAVGMQMEAIANLPEAKGVQLLWHDNFYDGPLNGVCEWQGDKYHFQRISEPQWIYSLRKLDEEEWEARRAQHSLFQQHVGTNTDYVDGKRELGNLRPQSEWRKFYDNAQVIKPSNTSITAWFKR